LTSRLVLRAAPCSSGITLNLQSSCEGDVELVGYRIIQKTI
jgi:hypothetical protein